MRGEESPPIQPNTYRILILGDSQAFGVGVNDQETFAYQLEELLTIHFKDMDMQVINGGVPGYGTGEELAFLKTRGPILKPDLVILQFLSVNDFEENRSHAAEWAAVKDGRLTASQTAGWHYYPETWWQKVQGWYKSKSHLARLVSARLGYLLMRWGVLVSQEDIWGENFSEADAELTMEYLVAIAEESNNLNADCLFLYTTGQAHVISNKLATPRSARFMEEVALRAGVKSLNSLDYLRGRPDKFDLFYPKDGHWTAAGHRAIAEMLYEEIIKSNLIREP